MPEKDLDLDAVVLLDFRCRRIELLALLVSVASGFRRFCVDVCEVVFWDNCRIMRVEPVRIECAS